MGSRWKKAKEAIRSNLCIFIPTSDQDLPPHTFNEKNFRSNSISTRTNLRSSMTSSSSQLTFSFLKYSGSSSKKICSICLGSMKPGQGHALFTAECSHSFHFNCIVSNINHGNRTCPVCRALWKEIPFRDGNISGCPPRRTRINEAESRRLGNPTFYSNRANISHTRTNTNPSSLFYDSDRGTFDDDETLDIQSEMATNGLNSSSLRGNLEVITYPELSAIQKSVSQEDFSILIHLKAPGSVIASSESGSVSRVPVDLVTVLDVSGSMVGTKLALLKQAMAFVIQHLSSSDRLSIIVFSTSTRRLFPLIRMSASGQARALQAVDSLLSGGSTKILEGLMKGVKVMKDRKEKNPSAGIILLSDGQNTFPVPDINLNTQPIDSQIPIHTFGFGVDHDAAFMHSISDSSGGTFSFIEAENTVQDAFAQCIGGLLSVVVQDLSIEIECQNPNVSLSHIKAGSYPHEISKEKRKGVITGGSLYADEERDFLVSVNIPTDTSSDEMSLIEVSCFYTHPITKKGVHVETQSVKIQRLETAHEYVPNIEIDRQRNRLNAADAMSRAREAADRRNLNDAIAVLEASRRQILESNAVRVGDPLSIALGLEMLEMKERMVSMQIYETMGRAYVLSGLSSHSLQRATSRGDSTSNSYQTSSMAEMLTRSRSMHPRSGPHQSRRLRHSLSVSDLP